MKDGTILASRTDLKGILTYANKAFIEISGFEEHELVGKNHNVVRHPHMPPEAFEDLWFTIKQGKPWVGIVKNRCKNGDFYWVKATVSPVVKNGQIVEYLSVRTKPSTEQVAQAEAFYRDIKAGKAMTIYHDLKLDKLDCTVAIIKNARSNKMGKKDIIKVECPVENLDLDILGFIDHNITVNVIKDEKIVAKKELKLPNQVVNVIKCKNPRCITSIEQGLDQIFVLADKEKEVYRCKYCEEKYTGKRNK